MSIHWLQVTMIDLKEFDLLIILWGKYYNTNPANLYSWLLQALVNQFLGYIKTGGIDKDRRANDSSSAHLSTQMHKDVALYH